MEKSGFQEAWQYAIETARRKVSEVAERLKVHVLLCFVPRPIPIFLMLYAEKLMHATLKYWQWAWGQGYVYGS